MKNIIKKMLKETVDKKEMNFILNSLFSGNIKKPYLKNLMDYGYEVKDVKKILNLFFKNYNTEYDVLLNSIHGLTVYLNSKRDKYIYREGIGGYWEMYEYDKMGNTIYWEDFGGNWVKREYEYQGGLINKSILVYIETSDKGIILDDR